MGEKKLTINDIARLSGVSKSTVSRVITGSGYVRDDTREKVERVIRMHSFQPSASAQTLSGHTSHTIGVVIPEIGNTFYQDLFTGISTVLDENGYTVIYCNTDNDEAKEEKALMNLQGQQVRGLIYAPAVSYEDTGDYHRVLGMIRHTGAEVVLVDRELPNSTYDSVLNDNFGSGYRATAELIRSGCKTIGFITGNMTLAIARERFRGFLQAMKDLGVPVERRYIYYGDYTLSTSYRISRQMYESGDVPEGIVTSNNDTTLGLLKATAERNYMFGREIAVVGIDRIPVLDIVRYPLSYITRDSVEMGKITARALLNRIENPDLPRQKVVMPCRMVLNGSEKINRIDSEERLDKAKENMYSKIMNRNDSVSKKDDQQ